MADHSSQIGAEKVLLIIGIALEDLPEPGQTLSFDKVKVLAIVPGKHWKKEDVGREYQKLAEQDLFQETLFNKICDRVTYIV